MRALLRFRKEVYLYLKRSFGKREKLLPVYISFLFFIAVIELITPRLYRIFVNQILLQGKIQLLLYIVIAYLVLYAVNCSLSMVNRTLLNQFMNVLEYRLRLQGIKRWMYPAQNRDDDQEIGEKKVQIDNDVRKIAEFLQEQFGKFEVKILLIIGAGIFLLLTNWQLALLGMIAIPVTLWIDYEISKKENILNEGNRRNDSQMYTWLYSVVNSWKQIRMYNQEKSQERRFIRYQHYYARYNSKWINLWVTRFLIIPKIKNEFLMEFGVCFLGGIYIIQGRLTPGDLLVFIVYYHLLTSSMSELSSLQASLKSEMPSLRRAMECKDEVSDYTGQLVQECSSIQKITLDQVSFGYGDSEPLFTKLSGEFETGDCVRIKGKSGCGKSTLLKLILGLEKVKSGAIYVNDYDLAELDLQSYYSKISGYMQSTYLFNDTVRENLLYAAPLAKECDLLNVCEKAHISAEIKKSPDGLDLMTGERGSLLSGGQAQRVLLARVFLKNADMYFFDEVTSALDDRTAEAVINEIQGLSEEKIVFIISHDDRVDRICNKTIVL